MAAMRSFEPVSSRRKSEDVGPLSRQSSARIPTPSVRKPVRRKRAPSAGTSPASETESLIGRRIQRYKILAYVGGGGIGKVWKAEHERLDRPVALKLLKDELATLPAARRDFEQEANRAARLNHPNIAIVYDADEFEGRLYIASEFVQGSTLRDLLRSGPLPIPEAVRIAGHVASALQHAHERRVQHRDISTANIMIGPGGGVKVIDWGLARLHKEVTTRLTPTGPICGTGPYVPPEVLKGNDSEFRADLYSLGVVLYEMLTGATPFQAPTLEALFHMILNVRPDPPSARRPAVPAQLDRVVLKALAKDPTRRHATAESFIRELEKLDLADDGTPMPIVKERCAPRAASNGATKPRFLAVLPFRDDSVGRPSRAARAFARGLASMVSSRLAQVPGIHVIAPFGLPEKIEPEPLARELGAQLLLEGSVRRVGRRIRVRFSLLSPRRVQIAGDTIDGTTADLGALEDLLTRRIAHVLELETALIPSPPVMEPVDPAAEERYAQALGYLQRYENEASVDGAIHLLEKLRRGADRDARIPAALGRAYLAKYRLTLEPEWKTKAREACKAALAIDRRLPEVLTTLGHVHRETGKAKDAVEAYRKSLALEPNEPDVLCHLAWAYQQCDEAGRAEQALKTALELRPSHWSTHNMLGVLLFRQGRYEEAAEQWVAVTQLSPDNARGYSNLGSAYYHQGRYPEAIQAYERSLAINPDATAHSSLGTLYFFLGDRARAVGEFEKGRNLRPSDPRVWANLADAYRWTPGREADAAAAFEKAIALRKEQLAVDRGQGRYWAELGCWLAKRGRAAEARRALERGLELLPEDIGCMTYAIRVHHLAGDREGALRWLERAVRGGCDIAELKQDPELAELRQDPEFERTVRVGRA